jgi:SAM-dependent methyltransferase
MTWESEARNWIAWARTPGHDAGSFDVVIAYNSLMDVDDMPGVVREAGRVLEPGGRFCICVTHPFFDAGEWESPEPDARNALEDPRHDRVPLFLHLRALKPA